MATETVVGGDSRGKQKSVDGSSKVYSRKNSINKGRIRESLSLQDPLQTLAAADGGNNASQHHAAASDDSSSHNRLEGTPGYVKHGNLVQIRLNSLRKTEARAMKSRLVDELDLVRKLVKRLEAKEAKFSSENTNPQVSGNQIVEKAGKIARVNSDVGSVGPPISRPFPGLSVSVVENDLRHPAHVEVCEKDKRTPKANQYYKNSDFLMGKERLTMSDGKKKLKPNGKKSNVRETTGGHSRDVFSSHLLKSCSGLLSRLMKHKFGWVFNAPVDVKGLKLHDYYTIVKHPMDLGTVKTKLTKKLYKSPKDFAEDVRLTFNNALLYNPKEQDVHVMAGTLLKFFEEQWGAFEDQHKADFSLPTVPARKKIPASAGTLVPAPSTPAPFAPPPSSETRTLEPMLLDSNPIEASSAPSGKGHVAKKPKAKDADKRDMTYEEKQKLSVNLQSLPSDKLESIIRIIRKRNSALCQEEDEIEVDIDSVDPETLWELDRFVTNYKKSLSKNKRKAEVALQSSQEVEPTREAQTDIQETSIVPPAPEEPRTVDLVVEERVPAPSPVQQEGQRNNMSGSSSSSSSSSDSGSSSDSESDSSSS